MKVNKICCILLLLLFSGLESEYEKTRMYFATLDFSLILSFCSVIDEVADIFHYSWIFFTKMLEYQVLPK